MNYESGPMVHVKIDRDVFSDRQERLWVLVGDRLEMAF